LSLTLHSTGQAWRSDGATDNQVPAYGGRVAGTPLYLNEHFLDKGLYKRAVGYRIDDLFLDILGNVAANYFKVVLGINYLLSDVPPCWKAKALFYKGLEFFGAHCSH